MSDDYPHEVLAFADGPIEIITIRYRPGPDGTYGVAHGVLWARIRAAVAAAIEAGELKY